MVSQAELISNGYHSLVPGLISIFLETVWVPLTYVIGENVKKNPEIFLPPQAQDSGHEVQRESHILFH